MITSQDIKTAAKRMGADIVGIGSIDRWSTAPIQMDPKQIMPNAKSVIALGFRILRGSLRGIEEAFGHGSDRHGHSCGLKAAVSPERCR